MHYYIIQNLLLVALNTWEAIFSFLAVYCTAQGLKKIWFEQSKKTNNLSEKKRKKPDSLARKFAISLFYLLHIAALFLAAGIFGEALISASLATLLVSTTSLINDYYEYFLEYYKNHKREKKLKNLQEKFSHDNIDYEQNGFFFEDVMNLQNEIEALRLQQDELLYDLNRIENQAASSTNPKALKKIADALKERYDSIIDENEVIRNFKKISNRLKLNEYQIIINTNKEMSALNQQKIKLQRKIQALSKTTQYESSGKKSLTKEISLLEEQINKLVIVNRHFYKIKMAKDTIIEIRKQLKKLDQKYRMKPFNEYNEHDNAALKKLESDYLHDRIKSLNSFIQETIHPELNKDKITTTNVSLVGYDKIVSLNKSPDGATLKSSLQQQINQISKLLKIKGKSLSEKQRYLQLIAINPNKQFPRDIAKIFNKRRALIKLQNKWELAKEDERHNLSAFRYSLITAGLVIVMCCSSIWIISELFDNLIRFIGVLAGATTIFNFFERRNAEEKINAIEQEQFDLLIQDCKDRAKNVKVPQHHTAVKVKMFALIEELEKSLATKEEPQTPTSVTKAKKVLPQFVRTKESYNLRSSKDFNSPKPANEPLRPLRRRM